MDYAALSEQAAYTRRLADLWARVIHPMERDSPYAFGAPGQGEAGTYQLILNTPK